MKHRGGFLLKEYLGHREFNKLINQTRHVGEAAVRESMIWTSAICSIESKTRAIPSWGRRRDIDQEHSHIELCHHLLLLNVACFLICIGHPFDNG